MKKFSLLLFSGAFSFFTHAQDSINQAASLPEKYYTRLSDKLTKLERQLDKKATKYLQKIVRREKQIYKKLWEKDSTKAKMLFGQGVAGYRNLQNKAAEQARKLSNFSRVYSGKLDSLGTAFRFMERTGLLKPELHSSIRDGLNSINNLQLKLDETDQIKKYFIERASFLKEQLLENGLAKELQHLNKEIYYYRQQVQEYKDLLNDPVRLEEKLLGVLSQLPAFRDYFNQHSSLAGLFRLPGSSASNSTISMVGLQTRASLTQDMQNRFGTDPSVQRMLQQSMQQGQDRLRQAGNYQGWQSETGNSDNAGIQDFKPNSQKTKNFWQRLEPGTNLQSQRNNGILPATSDIGLSLGYKLNDKSVVGIGAAYKIGWGDNIRNIRISHQGIGLRSFIDWKLKGSFFISGGYEMNYRSEFERAEQLKQFDSWQQSGLIGLSKIVSLNSKIFAKTKIQLLYDFLHTRQAPVTRPLLFRIGYNF